MDGELDVVRNVEIEQHLQTCSVCLPIYKQYQALQGAMRADSLYFNAPPHLQKRIHSSLHQANTRKPILRIVPWRPLSAVAALVALVILSWSLVRIFSVPSQNDPLPQDAVSTHIRSLMPRHFFHLASSNHHPPNPS